MTNLTRSNLGAEARDGGLETESQDMTSQRSNLSAGWLQSNLGEVCTYIQRGKGPRYSTETNDFPIVNQKAIRWNGIEQQHLKYVDPIQWEKWEDIRFIRQGDILWNSTGTGTIGRACYLTVEEAKKAKVVDSHVTIVRAAKNLDSRFVFYWVMHPEVQGRVGSLYTGTTNQVELSKKMVEELEIPLPPLAEQKVISDKLVTLLTQVETTKARLERIPNILKTFRQSVLAAAVSGKLTEAWRANNNLPLPKEVKLGQIVCEGPQNGLYKAQSFYGDGVRIIRIDGFYDGEIIDWDKIKRLSLEDSEYLKWKLEVGDILVNRVNSIEYLGKSAIVRELPEPTVFESNIMKFRVNSEEAIPEYIVKFLCSTTGISQLRINAKLAVNQASINQQDVKDCTIYLPVVPEQTEIVRRVEELFAFADSIEQKVNAALKRVNNLTQSILAKAFRGELTLEWRAANPDLISGENSAEALLEKIKAEREALYNKKHSKKKNNARKKG